MARSPLTPPKPTRCTMSMSRSSARPMSRVRAGPDPPAADSNTSRGPSQVRPTTAAPEPEWKRSEEHTSELQSRRDLVCRLLLEKKKNNQQEQLSMHVFCHLSNRDIGLQF